MKRIGIISDTHGYLDIIDAALEQTIDEDIDIWLHCGDYGDDARYMEKQTDIPVYAVCGNNDQMQPLEPNEQLITIENTYIYMTHGHKVSYYNRISELLHLGQSMGARLVVAGHTHVKEVYHLGNAVFVNPGSAALPRDGREGSYVIVTYKDDEFTVEFFRL